MTDKPGWPRRWPVAVISLPAAVATWSGWVGLGEMAAFGKVKLLPGIWDELKLNTAVTLPIGVEAYAAFALSAALTSAPVSASTRRFAWVSSVAALGLGMGAQIAYHLLKNDGRTVAPWQITTFVSSLPVLVLGLSAVLAHMLHRDRIAAAAAAAAEPVTAWRPVTGAAREHALDVPALEPVDGDALDSGPVEPEAEEPPSLGVLPDSESVHVNGRERAAGVLSSGGSALASGRDRLDMVLPDVESVRERSRERSPGVLPADEPALATARKRFAEMLASGEVPSVRQIIREVNVGHARASRIKEALDRL